MATVGQFNKVWSHWSKMLILGGGLTEGAKAEIHPLFEALSIEFEKQFGVSIQKVNTVSQDLEIVGPALEALKAWIERISKSVVREIDYFAWCDLH